MFTNFHTTSPICTPSRYSLFPGNHASRARNAEFQRRMQRENMALPEFNTYIEPSEITLPRLLQGQGYRTGFVGKNHVVAGSRELPVSRGADLNDPVVRTQLEAAYEEQRDKIKGIGFDEVYSVYRKNPDDNPIAALRVHNLDWIVQGALRFIDNSQGAPFFLYFSSTIPHGPLEPEKSWNADPRATARGLLDTAPGVLPSRDDLSDRVRQAGFDGQENALWLDDSIAAVLDRLIELQLLDKTTILFISDHGMAAKGSIYDGGTRTPAMLWRSAELDVGRSSTAIANTDVLPTLLTLAGGSPAIPADIDGRDFSHLLTNNSLAHRDALYFDLGYSRGVLWRQWKYIAVRHSPWLQAWTRQQRQDYIDQVNAFISRSGRIDPYVRSADDPFAHYTTLPGGFNLEHAVAQEHPAYYAADQLYNLGSDPTEQTNLYQDPQYADIISSARKRLTGFVRELPGHFGEFTQD